MPYGGSERDFEALQKKPRKTFLFDPDDGKIHLIYAGAMLPKAYDVLERLLSALVLLRQRNPSLADKLRVHFVGTGLLEGDKEHGHTIQPYIERLGLDPMVSEMPSRIKYLDVLNHLEKSTAILVIGSTEVHYSPSKIYLGIMARRPMFALLHEDSTAVATLRESRTAKVFTFRPDRLPEPNELSLALGSFLTTYQYERDQMDMTAFRKVSARESSRILASALDSALARANES